MYLQIRENFLNFQKLCCPFCITYALFIIKAELLAIQSHQIINKIILRLYSEKNLYIMLFVLFNGTKGANLSLTIGLKLLSNQDLGLWEFFLLSQPLFGIILILKYNKRKVLLFISLLVGLFTGALDFFSPFYANENVGFLS